MTKAREKSLPVGTDEAPPLKKKRSDRLSEMRANPKADWRIEDVKFLCKEIGLKCAEPSGGSHYVVTSPHGLGGQTVPYAKPIKPYYIKRLVSLAEAHLRGEERKAAEASAKPPVRKGKGAER